MVSVFYHTDMDGHTSAAIIRNMFPDAVCIPVNYGRECKFDRIFKGTTMYVVDFAFDLETMKKLNEEYELIWIDHHPVIDEYAQLGFNPRGLRRKDVSAAHLVWEYFHPNESIPDTVRYVSDYDTWSKKYKESNYFVYSSGMIDTKPGKFTDVTWKRLLTDKTYVANMVAVGKEISDYVNLYNKLVCEDICFETEFDGLPVLAANIKTTNSMIFDSMKSEFSKYKLQVIFGYFPNISASRYSVFSISDVNAGNVCKRYGGGGHAGAAGFIRVEHPFKLNIRPNKQPTYENIYKPLEELKAKSMIAEVYERDSISLSVLTLKFPINNKYNRNIVAINHPTIFKKMLFDAKLNFDYDIAMVYVYTNSGYYRLRYYPLKNTTLEDIQKMTGGTIVGDSVWKYQKEDPRINIE